MNKNDELTDCYEVTFTINYTVFVRGAESEEKAYEYAEDELPIGMSGCVDRSEIVRLKASEAESSRRHADERAEG
jgi:hypothetical protein